MVITIFQAPPATRLVRPVHIPEWLTWTVCDHWTFGTPEPRYIKVVSGPINRFARPFSFPEGLRVVTWLSVRGPHEQLWRTV